MKILIFDNYDSFTYNLLHLIKELGYSDVEVHRNDRLDLDAAEQFDKIVLSPGPGIPSEAGLLLPLIQRYAPKKSILGVCLGHQAIAESFGAKLRNLSDVFHGVATPVNVVAQHSIFSGLPQSAFSELPASFEVGRYHSWTVSRENFPDELQITATDSNGDIMALKHRHYDVHGVQFHPESVLTPNGKLIMEQFLKN
ncbi:MAG: aminodeoxychorismate/anthranilate synthase component II [Bacteroidales bacterium]|jgi:anthranilate synthase component 2|nr:aminodeoxychorismate/anthranilate synthase component II [Bacteroidales bacterium]